MSLSHAYGALVESGRNKEQKLALGSPGEALAKLVEYADEQRLLETTHPWELAPRVCRRLEEEIGTAPPGGWARLAGLAAGAGVLHASSDGFVSLATSEWIRSFPDGFRKRLTEAFTTKLIPPAAAAALYVALDVHPVWGLRLGRDVGACDASIGGPLDASDEESLDIVRKLVFGTLSGMLVAMRDLDPDQKYPVDALGDVLWNSAIASRDIAGMADGGGIPVFVDAAIDQRRMLTTRMAVTDLLDYVFVPAGVARRDDSGWFVVDALALETVRIGHFDRDEQEEWFELLCEAGPRAA